MKRMALVAASALVLLACEDHHKESKELTAAEVVADIRINREGSTTNSTTRTRIVANLQSEGIDVKLTNGDQIQVTQDDKKVILQRDREIGDHAYAALTDIEFDPGKPVHVVMTQEDKEADDIWFPIDLAPSDLEASSLHFENITMMPTPLALTQPSQSLTVNSSSDQVTVSWDQSDRPGEDMRMFYKTTCYSGDERNGEISIANDPGTISVAVSELLKDQHLSEGSPDNDEASIYLFWLLMAWLYENADEIELEERSASTEVAQNIPPLGCDINLTLVRETIGEVDQDLNGISSLVATHSVNRKVYYRP